MASVAYAVAALVFFGVTIYALVANWSATAAVAGGLCVAFILMGQLPLLESFEILTLKAKFTQRISQFDELLNHVRQSALVSSNLLYSQLAFGDRMDGFGWRKKREFLQELDENLTALNVPSARLAQMKRPFLELTSLDLLRVFESLLRSHVGKALEAANLELTNYTKGQSVAANDARYLGLIENLKLHNFTGFEFKADSPNPELEQMANLIDRQLKYVKLEEEDVVKLRRVGVEVASLADGCWADQTITLDAIEYLEQWEGNR